MTKLTQKQKMEIYCVKHSHANYIYTFFGYVYCGRCDTQIGDKLGGIFDTREKIVVGHKCDKCNALKKKLNPMDKKILKKLEASRRFRYDRKTTD